MSAILYIDIIEKNACNRERVLSLVKNLDNVYIPSISSLVYISEYVDKLYKNAEILILQVDGYDAGLCGFYANNQETRVAFISTIGLLPNYQRKGFGKILLDCVRNRIFEMGFKAIELEVYTDNQKAYDFYIKYGFILKSSKETSDILIYNLE